MKTRGKALVVGMHQPLRKRKSNEREGRRKPAFLSALEANTKSDEAAAIVPCGTLSGHEIVHQNLTDSRVNIYLIRNTQRLLVDASRAGLQAGPNVFRGFGKR